jgi:hypothetical protein
LELIEHSIDRLCASLGAQEEPLPKGVRLVPERIIQDGDDVLQG